MQELNTVVEQMELIYRLQLDSLYCALLCFPFLIVVFAFPLGQEYTNIFCKETNSKYFRLSVSNESL